VHATFSVITALKQTEAALRHAKQVADEATAKAEMAYQRASELHAELDAEFRRTAEIQAQLLPHAAPDLPGYEFAGVCLPARQVGGDFFDWLAGNDAIRISLGDVMGKGMPASLLTATVRAALRVVAHLPVSEAVEAVNRALSPDLMRSDSFVTLFHAALAPESGQLTYVDAGHGMVFIQRRDGTVERLRQHNLPLGVLPDAIYPAGTTTLEPGDTLVIYSDGLPDARPELRLDAVGVAGQIEELPDAQAKLEQLVNLVSDIQTRPDDLTLVLLRRRQDKDVEVRTVASSQT
jgi:serine phosphatase RsbU (regulator of sigma subunit)